MVGRVALGTTLLLLLVAVLTGCSRPTGPAPDPTAEVTVTRTGGVAGLRQVLHVRPDGVAVLVGVRGGRLGADRLAELRALLGDPALVEEAAALRERGRRDSPRCSDLIARGLRVGDLAMSVTDRCAGERVTPTPTFDRVLALLADGLGGRFDEALRPGDVVPVTLRTEQRGGSRGPYAVDAAEDGSLTLTRPGAADRRAALTAEQRDAAALVGAGLADQPLTACNGGDEPWTLSVRVPGRDEVGGPGCAFGPRALDAAVLHLALVAPFDLG